MARWPVARGAALAACVLLAGACSEGKVEQNPPGGGGGTGGGECVPACAEGQSCSGGVCVDDETPATDTDGDGVLDADDRCGATPAGSAVNAEGCAWDEEPVPFSEGPYGTGIRDTAGDFTLQTLDGPFVFREAWTGNDSHLFVFHAAGQAYADGLWTSDLRKLLVESPANVHYFFADGGADEAARRASVEELRGRFETALGKLGDEAAAAAWRARLHFVTDDLRTVGGNVGAFFQAHPAFAFAIDRFQRWREVGLLLDLRRNVPQLRYLAREAHGFEYERRLERKLGALDATEVVVFDGDRYPGGWETAVDVEISLPPAATMAGFDSMAVYLYTACPGHLQGVEAGCNEWDYAHQLFLCDANDPTWCETELVRYVTPYGREGEWLTDVSELLPLVDGGGTRTLRYVGPNAYDMHMKIVLWNAGKPYRAKELRFLYGQSGAIPWNETYNEQFAPVTFTVDDPAATKVGIYNVVTGHGFGSTWENCAEFCNSEHEFSVNGTAFTESHPEADENEGCFDRVDQGVVPNQFGTWPFGRAGWCPGWDVKPWVQDVSGALVSGENQIAYRALYRGQPYVPQVNDQGDYMPELRLQSWLVLYEARK